MTVLLLVEHLAPLDVLPPLGPFHWSSYVFAPDGFQSMSWLPWISGLPSLSSDPPNHLLLLGLPPGAQQKYGAEG